MVEIPISDQMLLDARRKAVEMGRLRKSIQKGGGAITGFLGEFIAKEALGGAIKNTYDYDLVVDSNKIDVKSKLTSAIPLESYDCSVSNYNTQQKCDYYAFVRVLNDFSKGWFLGVKKKDDFFKEARFVKKGDIDESNGFRAKSDCYSLRVSELDKGIDFFF